MREYVPCSSFVVGNKVVTSHGLLKPWTGENLNTEIGFRGKMAECVTTRPTLPCCARGSADSLLAIYRPANGRS